MKHHYIPQFYLRMWHAPGEEKAISYTRDPKGKLRFDYKASKSICFNKELYTIQADGFLSFQATNEEIEKNFFQKLDNASALIHQILITKSASDLSEGQREIWSRFIVSLMERNPWNIEELSEKYIPEIHEALKEVLDKSPSESFRRMAEKIMKGTDIRKAARNATLLAMTNYIEQDPIAKKIKDMDWWTIDLTDENEHFLTSDNPILINGGKSRSPIYSISLALSPKRLLVITQQHTDLDEEFVRTLAISYNLLMCDQANHFLISSQRLQKGRYTNYIRAAELLFCKKSSANTES